MTELGNFQNTILKIAVAFLVLMLIVIGYLLYKTKAGMTFPPYVSTCPDYFEMNSKGECINVRNMGDTSGMCATVPVDPKTPLNKCIWAKNCNLTWDGITNVNMENCP